MTVFNGQGGQWSATITQIKHNAVEVQINQHEHIEREAAVSVTLLVGIPANERMDFLVKKQLSLVFMLFIPSSLNALLSGLMLNAVRKKQRTGSAVVIAACEQCARNRIPEIYPVMPFQHLLKAHAATLPVQRRMLSLNQTQLWEQVAPQSAVCILSGPEGGLTAEEERYAIDQAQFKPYSLDPRTLRADIAPLAALASLVI